MPDPDSAPASPPAPRPRHDGWTIARQLAFIRALYFTGCVTRAAAAAGMSREGAYRLRARPGQHAFAGAWGLALAARAAEAHTPATEAHTGAAKSHGPGGGPGALVSGKGHKSHDQPHSATPHQFHQLGRPVRPANEMTIPRQALRRE